MSATVFLRKSYKTHIEQTTYTFIHFPIPFTNTSGARYIT